MMGDYGDMFAAAFRTLFLLGILVGMAAGGLVWAFVKAWQAWGPTITVGW